MEKLPEAETLLNNEEIGGFEWRRGIDRMTTGIHMSSEVFKHDYEDGRKIAIILLDTQGIFDTEADIDDCTTIFALSTLLSSVQMFNISQNIQATDLQHLQLFAGYGRLAANQNGLRPSQKLLFLVRDWCNQDEFGFGMAGGKDYFVKKVIKIQPGQQNDRQKMMKHIHSCFEDIGCFLMPHPGIEVQCSPEFAGHRDDIDENFLKNVDSLVSELLDPEKLQVKKINGQPVTAHEFVDYFEKYFASLNGTGMPNIDAIYEVTSKIHNQKVFRKCQQSYAFKMTKTELAFVLLSEEKSDVEVIHDRVKRETMTLFYEEALLGSTSTEYFGNKLVEFLQFSLEGFLQLNSIIALVKRGSAIAAVGAFGLRLPVEAGHVVPIITLILNSNAMLIPPLTYLSTFFMSYYEKLKFPESFANESELTRNFWQAHYKPSEKPANESQLETPFKSA